MTFAVPFRAVREAQTVRYKQDSAPLGAVLDAMVAMEQETLGWLDAEHNLAYNFGRDLPDQLSTSNWPNILHYLSTRGVALTSFMMGQGGVNQTTLAAHPGGLRVHRIGITIAVLVGSGKELNAQLLNKTLFWLEWFDRAYSANGSLGGTCLGTKLVSAVAGHIDYAGEPYFGWLFEAEVTAQYIMKGDGPDA